MSVQTRLTARELEHLLEGVTEITVKAARFASQIASPSADRVATTQVDRLIDEELSANLPHLLRVGILSEESGLSKSSELLWVVDPLDGTFNAIARVPDVAVSVALVNLEQMQPLLGVVVVPHHELVFAGALDCGATCNSKPLPTMQPNDKIPLLAVGQPDAAQKHSNVFGQYFGQLIGDGWILRQSGSAALDICRTAAGHWHAFHEFAVKIWDVAAADIIAREAGCRSFVQASRFAPKDSEYWVDYLVCADTPATQSLRTHLAHADKGNSLDD
jgi:fructose-1,6-bisphosphatase/inositol monophosphatase family enzyme